MATGAYAVAVTKLSKLAAEIKEKSGKPVEYLDLGGGFASANTLKGNFLQGADSSPSIDDFADAISSALFDAGFKKDELPLLILETGRALIDDTAYLLGTVVSTKLLSNNRRAVIVDIGINILFTSLWYDHKVSPAQEFTHHTEDMSIYGPLCMNIDMLRENVNLPMLKKGDHIVVHNVGAYNMTQWMQFITLRPKVVMIDTHGQAHVIRENEAMENITSLERVPQHLLPAK
jgi:diaminopimelate decarboxylase